MKIIIERTGGFAGLKTRKEVDTDTLPRDESAHIHDLVEQSAFFRLPAKLLPEFPQPDRFQYTIEIVKDGQSHRLVSHEATLPKPLKDMAESLLRT